MKRVTLQAPGSRLQRPVCQFCQFSNAAQRRALPIARSPIASGSRASTRGLALQSQRRSVRPTTRAPLLSTHRYASMSSTREVAIEEVVQAAEAMRNADRVPANETVTKLLAKCENIAQSLVLSEHDQPEKTPTNDEGNAISSLLDLEEKKGQVARDGTSIPDPRLADELSRIATEIVKDEKVFINEEALESYTKTQTLLRRAEHFPEVFHLFANKPVPEENSAPPKFLKASPKSVNSAIPADLANMALDVAISQKNLSLVLAIIDNTFCAPAFHRAKVFKKAGVPLGGLAAAPMACYALASWAATIQNTMDPSTATGIAFAASLAYVGGTSSMGILAITTANDQMERVTWLSGIPLRQRWLREEERAAMDKVAVAWGFKDPYMRGEEVGEEWESLREFIGMRGMILDKTELMAGME
ncbi:hypothetical protein N7532_011566 [Penicillium argentinense]|uniref:Uncharacterized protein n=1 Tax=Penicillium argentinense TaxID=1131581 RepID=A0A9W9EIM7_9EURO|nr:uncharacterized protein N7532_011566 [Penicillium argentinense]KAJ5082523.1 hypothetical protein N7532_011566 [Penicillium argentinense]